MARGEVARARFKRGQEKAERFMVSRFTERRGKRAPETAVVEGEV